MLASILDVEDAIQTALVGAAETGNDIGCCSKGCMRSHFSTNFIGGRKFKLRRWVVLSRCINAQLSWASAFEDGQVGHGPWESYSSFESVDHPSIYTIDIDPCSNAQVITPLSCVKNHDLQSSMPVISSGTVVQLPHQRQSWIRTYDQTKSLEPRLFCKPSGGSECRPEMLNLKGWNCSSEIENIVSSKVCNWVRRATTVLKHCVC